MILIFNVGTYKLSINAWILNQKLSPQCIIDHGISKRNVIYPSIHKMEINAEIHNITFLTSFHFINGGWNLGTLEPWNHGTMEPWNLGTLKPWNLGTLEPWHLGTMEPWNHGTLEPLFSPFKEPWNLRTLEPWHLGTMEPWNHFLVHLRISLNHEKRPEINLENVGKQLFTIV